MFIPFLTRGGAEMQGFLLATGLAGKGYHVEICAFRNQHAQSNLIQELDKYQLNYFELPFGMEVFFSRYDTFKALWSFRKILTQKKIDIIIPFTWWCNFLSALVFRFAGVKQCFWNQRSVDHHVPVRKIEKLIPTSRITFVSNSNPGKKFISSRLKVPLEKISVIRNGVQMKNLNLNYENASAQRGDNKLFKIIMVANFFPEKDHATVLKGLKLMLNDRTDVQVLFAGNCENDFGMRAKSLAFDLKLCEHAI
ncbi:MAG: glycosyltransferase family 4 protein, partial [Chitinophagales bacterium]|nr:glycosyltransferase family 4 protein [Chitinophagales bacterium]MDW8274236.1 glycosyltransferase family 4 protein [Chitinophagales bacterium]